MTHRRRSEPTFTLAETVCLHATNAGLLVRSPNLPAHVEECWVPRAHVDELSEVFDVNHRGALVVPLWLAKRKGWTRPKALVPPVGPARRDASVSLRRPNLPD